MKIIHNFKNYFKKGKKGSPEDKARPKVVMTLLVRNEQDILRENVLFHSAMGVEAFVITDNASTDNTAKIISELRKNYKIVSIYEPELNHNQGTWVTTMARFAATDLDADWVINNDADEFWVPRIGNFKDLFLTISEDVLALSISRHNAILRSRLSTDNTSLFGNLIYFETNSCNDLNRPLPNKVCHRASTDIRVSEGNHSVCSNSKSKWPVSFSKELYILHFPKRSFKQFSHKIVNGAEALARNNSLPASTGDNWNELYKVHEAGGLRELWENWLRSEEQIQEMIQDESCFCDRTVDKTLLSSRSE